MVSATASSDRATSRPGFRSPLSRGVSLPYHFSPCGCCARDTSCAIERPTTMTEPDQIRKWLEESTLACEYVQVLGDGHHFEAVIVSPAFRGKSRVQQHQLVYAALGDRMSGEIHALSMQTWTPEDWAAQRDKRGH